MKSSSAPSSSKFLLLGESSAIILSRRFYCAVLLAGAYFLLHRGLVSLLGWAASYGLVDDPSFMSFRRGLSHPLFCRRFFLKET
jgi:hypothetical protein